MARYAAVIHGVSPHWLLGPLTACFFVEEVR